MAHDVFLSHSAQNREVADAICAALEKAAIRCWVAPRDVRPGRSFPGEITRAIQQSKVMLLVFSGHSNNSEQVLREVQLATDSHLPIIRFRIEDVALTDDLRYFLSTPHWLDALTPPLSKHIERLEVAIKELLGQAVEVTGKKVESEDAPPAAAPVVTPAPTTTVVPSAVAPAMPPPLPMPPPARTEREVVAQKSSNLGPLLAIGAVVILAAIIGVIFMVMRPKPSKQQMAATSPPSVQTPPAKTKTNPAPTPAKTSKVTQNTAVPPARPPKATPAPEKQPSSESESVSAFDRAGTLKRPSEPKSEPARKPGNEPKSAFDRAGGTIGSDQTKPEPSPDDE
jgi:TIR domain